MLWTLLKCGHFAKLQIITKIRRNEVHQQKRSPKTSSEICQVYKGMYINPTLSTTYFKRECSDLQEIPGAKLQRFKLDCTVLADTATALESLEPGLKKLTASIHWKWLIFFHDLIGNQQDPIWRLWVLVHDSGNFHGIFKFPYWISMISFLFKYLENEIW